MKLSFEIL